MSGSNSGRAARLAWGLWALAMLMAGAQVVLIVLARHVMASPGFGFPGSGSILTVVPATIGALVASRRSSNPIGWIFVAIGVESGVQGVGLGYALNGILGPHAPWPGAVFGAWLNAWLWFPAVIVATTILFQIFPSGTFLSARWRVVGWVTGVLAIVGSIGLALSPSPLEHFGKLSNPFGVHSPIVLAMGNVGFAAANLLIIVSAASLIVRYRRAALVEREQIKWLAYAGALAAVVIPAGDFVLAERSKIGDGLILLSILLIPIAIGVAVLRYRLYDIDRIITRTLSWTILSVLLGGMFALVVLVPTAAIGGGGKTPGWLVAMATLVAFGLFRPLRRRVQRTVDHRFNRSRYDAERTLQVFTARLRDQIDISTLTNEISDVVNATMQPQTVSLWLPEKT